MISYLRFLSRKLTHKPEEKVKISRESNAKKLQETINKLHKEESAEALESKNLARINFAELTPEARVYDPIRMFNEKNVKQLNENSTASNKAVEEYVKGEEGVDYIHPAESLTKAYANVHNEIINEVMEMQGLEATTKKDRQGVEEWRLERGITVSLKVY